MKNDPQFPGGKDTVIAGVQDYAVLAVSQDVSPIAPVILDTAFSTLSWAVLHWRGGQKGERENGKGIRGDLVGTFADGQIRASSNEIVPAHVPYIRRCVMLR